MKSLILSICLLVVLGCQHLKTEVGKDSSKLLNDNDRFATIIESKTRRNVEIEGVFLEAIACLASDTKNPDNLFKEPNDWRVRDLNIYAENGLVHMIFLKSRNLDFSKMKNKRNRELYENTHVSGRHYVYSLEKRRLLTTKEHPVFATDY